MIGSSLPLCYPQIAVPDLLYHRALCFISPLTKHIRLVGVCAFSGAFLGLELAPSKWRSLVPPDCRAAALSLSKRCRDIPAGTLPRARGAYASRWLAYGQQQGSCRGGADLRNFTLAACLLGCLMASCSPKQPPTTRKQSTSTIGYPSAEAIVTSVSCGPSEKPLSGYLVVDDSVAIPVTTPEGQPLQVSQGDFDQEGRWYFDDHGRWLWAKSGLVVRGNTDIEISAPLDSPLRFDWGEEPLVPRRSLRVECSTPQWMALIGGYFASSKGCFPLDIRVGGRPTVQVHVQMGAACLQGMETP